MGPEIPPPEGPALLEELSFLEALSNLCGAAGDERGVRDFLRERLTGAAEDIAGNPLGNLAALVRGRGRPGVLITAHMDEVGFLVTGVESSGALRFHAVGGVAPSVQPGCAVVIGRKKRVPGVIGIKSLHLMPEEERGRIPRSRDLRIDIGASSRDEVRSVRPGDYVYFTSRFFTTPMGAEGPREEEEDAISWGEQRPGGASRGQDRHVLCWGKAFDDRAGCAAALSLVSGFTRERPGADVHMVFTAQEEAGLRGGMTAAFGLAEDVRFHLNLEGTTCADREQSGDRSPSTVMGDGPALTVMDRTTVTPKPLLDFALETARSRGIPCQLKRTLSGGTDAGPVHTTRTGIPSLTVSVPVRYLHGPWGMLASRDLHDLVRLARALIDEAPGFSGGS